jgi:hypothetical protein
MEKYIYDQEKPRPIIRGFNLLANLIKLNFNKFIFYKDRKIS